MHDSDSICSLKFELFVKTEILFEVTGSHVHKIKNQIKSNVTDNG